MVIKGGALRRYVVVGGMVALVTSGGVATASPAMGSATSATSPAAVPTAGPGSGLISTIAGGGPADGNPVAAVAFLPWSVTAAAAGVYVSTRTAVFRVDGAGTLIRVAGVPDGPGFSGDGGPAVEARLNRDTRISGSSTCSSSFLERCMGLAVDGGGNLYIADGANSRVRKVTPAGTITTVVGNGSVGVGGDGGPATEAQLENPDGLAFDGAGNLYIAGAGRIRKVDHSGIISSVVVVVDSQWGDSPVGLAVGPTGDLYFTTQDRRVRRRAPDGTLTTIAGGGTDTGDGGKATDALLTNPGGMTTDDKGAVYFTETSPGRVRRVTPDGSISTVAGGGTDTGDGGPATSAQINRPKGIVIDGQGRLLVADYFSHRVRAVSLTDGTIGTIAGNGSFGFSGDNVAATSAQLYQPGRSAVDAYGNVYVADMGNHVVRRIAADGVITTVAGTTVPGYSGDGGPGQAPSSTPRAGWRWTLRGTSTSLTGSGESTFSGDGGPAGAARLVDPSGVTLDSAGNLYISDQATNRIRVVGAASPSAGPGSTFHPVTPQRVLDSRDGTGGYTSPWPAGSSRNLTVTGAAGIPADATAVALNITVTQPSEMGYLTLYPAGATRPLASNINFSRGQTVGNLVVSGVGSDGQVSIYKDATGTAHVIADVMGYYTPTGGSTFTPQAPTRVLDSRTGTGGYDTPWPAGGSRDLTMTGGSSGTPAGATAVVLNVTVTEPAEVGYLTVHPAGSSRPLAASMNFSRGQTVANLVVAALSADGRITIANDVTGTVHVIADLVGYFAPTGGSTYTPVNPQRMLDTRYGPDGRSKGFTPGSDNVMPITGVGTGVPLDATAVVFNLTVTEPSEVGYLSAYPAAAPRPLASSINFSTGQTVANLVVVRVGDGGQMDIYKDQTGTAHVIADVVGYYR